MYSIIIRNGRLLDGEGNPWHTGDIGIKDDTIAYVGNLQGAKAKTEIDAQGLYVSPGFIDIHTHSDGVLWREGYGHSHIRQGVTTNVIGNCGTSIAPMSDLRRQTLDDEHDYPWDSMEEYLQFLEEKGLSINVVPLVGQGSIRQCVMGYDDRKPTADELEQMKQLVAQAMQSGSFGITTGLIYTPSCYADTEEIIALTKVVAQYGGIYASHIRGENDNVLTSIKEAIEVGRKAGVPVQIAHLKAMGKHMWGTSVDILAVIDEARAEGIEVTFDQYPYNASACGFSAVLPPWAHVGGAEKMRERLSKPNLRERMKEDILNGVDDWVSIHKGVGWDNIMITHSADASLTGKTIAEIAKERALDGFTTCFDLLENIKGRISIVYFTIGDEDLERIMQHPAMMVGSDSSAIAAQGLLAKGQPHPRSFGSFARVLGNYVREKNIITLEEAIRKMTSAPAQKIGLYDRGSLRPKTKADIVIFDAAAVADKATYTNPMQYPDGIEYVIVNGQITIAKGLHKQNLAGKVLRKG